MGTIYLIDYLLLYLSFDGSLLTEPNIVVLTVFPVYCEFETCFDTSKKRFVSRPLENFVFNFLVGWGRMDGRTKIKSIYYSIMLIFMRIYLSLPMLI